MKAWRLTMTEKLYITHTGSTGSTWMANIPERL